MTGDQPDMQRRIRAVLPSGWFPDVSPVLDALTSALGWSWAWAYSLLSYAGAQTRLATASGVWLDIAASDFFGDRIARQAGEGDDALRGRIGVELGRERGTRAAVLKAAGDCTGQTPALFEPSRTQDTGGWGGRGTGATGFAYGGAGGWGSLALPFQFFVTAYRPSASTAPTTSGWSSPAGGYGIGAVQYVAASELASGTTDAAIYAAIADVLPAGVVAWTQITNRRQ